MTTRRCARRLPAWILLPVFLMTLLLGACGGDKKPVDSSDAQSGASMQSGAPAPSDAQQTGDATAVDASGGTDGNGGTVGTNGQGGTNGSGAVQPGKTTAQGQKPGPNDGKTSATTTTTAATSNKPVVTKGYTFSIIAPLLPAKKASNNTLFEKLFFERVEEVQKELGCKINVINTMPVLPDNLAPLIQSGKKVGDVIEMEVRWMPSLIAAGYLKPWNDVPGINIQDENFTAGYTNLGTIGGKTYGLQFMKPPEVRYAVVMNKTLLKSRDVNPDTIYSLVDQKKWNFDTFRDYAKKATEVVGGVTRTYGMGGRPEYVVQELLAANNASLVTLDGKGKGSPTYTSAAVKQTLTFFNRLVNDDKVFLATEGMKKQSTFDTSLPEYYDEFIKGKIAFLFEDSWVLNQQIKPRVKNFDYGMIPIPMGPNGTKYVSPSNHARVFAVTSTNKDIAVTAKIFSELAKPPAGYTGKDWWMEDVQLDYFQNNDKKSLPVYKMMLDNAMWDVGLGIDSLVDGFNRSAVYGPIFWNNGLSTDAALESIKGVYDKTIREVFK